MANQNMFNSLLAKLPVTDAVNMEQAPAYAYSPKHKLAQLVMTGCMNQTFYADAQSQLADVLALTNQLDAQFIAQTAIYGRERGLMKDMPALLLAILAAKGAPELVPAFERVITNGKMLRNFVQIMRSGVTGRKSLGTRSKKLVQNWLNAATEPQLLQAMIGTSPSLADVIKMVHPKPNEPWREAFFAWLIGKPYDVNALPEQTRELLAFRSGASTQLPNVPFQLLSNEKLNSEQWAEMAGKMGWHALRMNLNTLARNQVFAVTGATETIAARIADPDQIKKAKVYPYQLLAAYRMSNGHVPAAISEALQDALDIALANIPQLAGQVVVCPDVSGSMRSPVTGYRQGATTTVSCIDVAGLISAAILRNHPTAKVLPFEVDVVNVNLNARDAVLTNAEKLAAIGGGGTNCSAPLARIVKEKIKVDTVILVSDNQSWIDRSRHGATETMQQWELLKRSCPQAKLICIDLQPYGTTQAHERADILNVGGFGDSVFDVMAQFAAGSFGASHWIEMIESIDVAGKPAIQATASG